MLTVLHNILGDVLAEYWFDCDSGFVGLEIIPKVFKPSDSLKNKSWPNIQPMIRGDDIPGGFANSLYHEGGALSSSVSLHTASQVKYPQQQSHSHRYPFW